MSQIQKHLVGLAQTATKKPVESGERLAASLVSRFKMKDGTEVALRPIRPDDESLMKQFHETLSDRTVYMCYFCSLSLRSRVEHERLVRICHVDGNREAVLVVDLKDELTGQHHILGVGRLIKLDTGRGKSPSWCPIGIRNMGWGPNCFVEWSRSRATRKCAAYRANCCGTISSFRSW
jgi:hypothetical protein